MPKSARMTAAQRRRRNLTYLAGFIIATFVLGLIPGLRFLLFVNVVACVLLVAYLVAAMVYAARPVRVPPAAASSDATDVGRPSEAASGTW